MVQTDDKSEDDSNARLLFLTSSEELLLYLAFLPDFVMAGCRKIQVGVLTA